MSVRNNSIFEKCCSLLRLSIRKVSKLHQTVDEIVYLRWKSRPFPLYCGRQQAVYQSLALNARSCELTHLRVRIQSCHSSDRLQRSSCYREEGTSARYESGTKDRDKLVIVKFSHLHNIGVDGP